MARNNRRGTQYEQKAVTLGRGLGYHVSSTRHFGGAGDQLWTPGRAVYQAVLGDLAYAGALLNSLLIEVKATAEYPWRSSWGPADREAMVATSYEYGFEPMLLWYVVVAGRMEAMFIPADEWPSSDWPST
jgi:hypothetical protein